MNIPEVIVFLSRMADELEDKRKPAYDAGDYETASICMGKITDIELIIKMLGSLNE